MAQKNPSYFGRGLAKMLTNRFHEPCMGYFNCYYITHLQTYSSLYIKNLLQSLHYKPTPVSSKAVLKVLIMTRAN